MTSILKEGFLLKRDDSFMFPGWKKKFCQLRSDGLFTIGDGKHVENKFNTKIDMKKVEHGFETESLNLPKGRSDMDSMFSVHVKHKKHYFLTNNSGECFAWMGALKNSQSQTNPVAPVMRPPPMQHPQAPPPYSNTPPQYHYQAQMGTHPYPHAHQSPYNPNY